MQTILRLSTALLALGSCCGAAAAKPSNEHVLSVSVDGIRRRGAAHSIHFIPQSALAKLAGHGVTYRATAQDAACHRTVSGSLADHGRFSAHDRRLVRRSLRPRPRATKGCKPGRGGKRRAPDADYSEALDVKNGSMFTSIDPAQLVVDPATCKPIYPHSLLRVNTIFEVVKAAGLRTAWSDKHPAYDLVNGPSGRASIDLFVPEITVLDGDDATESVEKRSPTTRSRRRRSSTSSRGKTAPASRRSASQPSLA